MEPRAERQSSRRASPLAPGVESIFGPGGLLVTLDPKFEPRPQQAEMASAVARALEDGGHLAVEAPTGVGKSLAYLLPAALWAAAGGRKVLVSTYTRALQEQIMEKELPLVADVMRRLGTELRYAMLQGSDNYLCVQRLSRLSETPELFSGGQNRALERLTRWAAGASSGHRSELPELIQQSLWGRIARDPDICSGPSSTI
jgi:ATP-dependent DNA helicase DinG